jgi:aspartyl-tRNA(Asn)/glutamyl-tRNA(Gln) amidotransferase subunit C
MSQVTKQDIAKIAGLAKIKISDEEHSKLAKQLDLVMNWIEQLNEVNTDNVEILTNVHNQTLRLEEDKVNDGDIAEDVLKNAKNSKYGYFTVPKVIE